MHNLWVFGGLALLSLTLIFVVTWQTLDARDRIIADTKDTMSNYSIAMEEHLNASLQTVQIVLNNTAEAIQENPDWQQHFTHISGKTLQKSFFEDSKMTVSIADKSGMIYRLDETKNTFAPSGRDVLDREWFHRVQAATTDDYVVSEPLIGKTTHEWIIVFARRLTDRHGRFAGAIWGSMRQEFFTSLRNKFLSESKDIFVVTAGTPLRFLYRSTSNSPSVGQEFQAPPVIEPVASGKIHRGVYQAKSYVDGADRIFSVSWVKNFPIMFIIGRDAEPLLSGWRTQSIFYLGLTATVLVFCALLVFSFLHSNNRYRQYQAQLTNSAKMVALGEMAGSIAHEINNPLMIISGHLQKVDRYMRESELNREKIQISLTRMHVTIERITKIISGLRLFSRDTEDETTSVSVSAVINEALALCRERFRASGVLIEVNLPKEELIVLVNETQLKQVLLNLLNNAFDAVQSRPAKWIRLEATVADNKVIFSITDSGQGIPSTLAQKIMEPFFTTKDVGKGTGLGLSISKGIVDKHNGKIYYDTQSVNTRFVFELPVQNSDVKTVA